MFEHMLDMIDNQFNRCVRISTTVCTQEAGSKVNAGNASSLSDSDQLPVCEISRTRGVDGRVRMRCYEGGIAGLGDVPEPAFVKVREINQNSQLIAGANQLFTEIGQTWSSIGRRGAEERHAVPERIRSAPNWAERAKSRRIQNVQQLEIRVDGFRAFEMKNSCQHAILQALLDLTDVAANANLAFRLPLDTEKKRQHAEYSRLRHRQFDGRRDQGVRIDVSRGRFVLWASCSIARRHENREQPPGESSLMRHWKIQLAFAPSFEECPGGVCAAAPVKTQQDVVVAVEDRHAPRRCHKRLAPLQIFRMRPLRDWRLSRRKLGWPSHRGSWKETEFILLRKH